MEEVAFRPQDSLRWTVKSTADKILAVLLILVLSPILLTIALVIKLESTGPVFFQQARHGLNNRVFYVWKFRSMRFTGKPDAGVLQVQKEDERATRVGRFLRRTSLDELPQLLNVLQGTMSLVGPRPHPLPLDKEYENTVEGYLKRYSVKPGITGWAQVNGHRGPVMDLASMCARLEHDDYYIKNWSLLLDAKILLMTLRRGFFHENAY